MKKFILVLIFLLGSSSAFAQSSSISTGIGSFLSLTTVSNCSSATAPATCGSSIAGSVAIASLATTITVNTTAVTANSQIFITEDASLGTKLAVTCNNTAGRTYAITARTAGTSFVITTNAAPSGSLACLSYLIVN